MNITNCKDTKHYLFVYGTLRKGLRNHYYLSGAKFIGYAKTKNKYNLTTDFNLPYVTVSKGISNIKGELYLICDDLLERIDILEGHPKYYKRKKVEIILNENNKVFSAWMYFAPKDALYTISEGDFMKFLSNAGNEI